MNENNSLVPTRKIRLYLADEAPCISATEAWTRFKAENKKKMIERTCYIRGEPQEKKSKFLPVDGSIVSGLRGTWLMDVVTGSLYQPETGRCRTSDELRISLS